MKRRVTGPIINYVLAFFAKQIRKKNALCYNTFMNKRITDETKKKLDAVFDTLKDTDKIVPNYQKLVFNFQGRKSSIIARKIIEGLTKESDIILDPFFGSGSFLIAAAQSGRKVVGVELDNYTFSVVKTLLSKIDFSKFNQLFKALKDDVESRTMYLYETRVDGEVGYIKKLHFDPVDKEYFSPKNHRDIKNGCNIILESIAGKKNKYKRFDEFDLEKIREIEKIDTSRFPHHKLIENSRINITKFTGADYYDANFTNRAKAALLYIQDGINRLPKCVERDVLEFSLVSSISLSKIAMYGDGTNNLYHVILYSAQERNVWTLFESTVDKFLAYKKFLHNILQDSFDLDSKICLVNGDYKDFLDSKDTVYDCIYTDPPYSDQVPYLEYSQYYRDWLRIFYDSSSFTLTDYMLNHEIVVTNAPSRRDKNFNNYYKDIDSCFGVLNKHLKENGFLILTIKLGTAKFFKILTEFIESGRKNGFELAGKYVIDCTDPTIRRQAALKSTLIKQMVLVFQKMPEEKRYWYIERTNVDNLVKKIIYRLIDKSNNKFITINEAISSVKDCLQNKLDYIPSQADLCKINELINCDFMVLDGYVHFNNNELYLGLEDNDSLLIKLYDIIPVIIKRLLREKKSFTLDDLFNEISFLLLDGDTSLIELLNTNPHCKSTISNLLDNYCDVVNEKYVAKIANNFRTNGSIDISTLDGYELEQLMKELLIAEGYLDVVKTGKSGDRGVDLIATEKLPNGTKQKVIFQCKRWIGTVGSVPIQRLHSMMSLDPDKIKRAVCVTTSNYSQEAKEVAEQTGVELVSGMGLLSRLQRVFGDKYYHGALGVVVY